jgi:hypothetical protein
MLPAEQFWVFGQGQGERTRAKVKGGNVRYVKKMLGF